MTINCKGKLIDVSKPKVMGILNLTPDSFFDGGKYKSDLEVLSQTEKMLLEGATFIDLGAVSSKPNASEISESDELKRLIPFVEKILQNFPEAILSIDTFRSKVAAQSVQSGAAMINDISAGSFDEDMMKTVANLSVPYVMMHMKGTPQTMQLLANYDNVLKEILFYFSQKMELARSFGICDLIVDPGFGFAKTIDQNFEILKKMNLFKTLEVPILVGVSRKSMIYKKLNINAIDALNGTTVLNVFAIQKGSSILRVHDVKEAIQTIKLCDELS
jgi:dihydropteroate synthase